MKNLENIKLVLDKIENNPDCWVQKYWHCGASHCFAGWAQILSGNAPNNETVRRDARMFLGFNIREANYYFNGRRTLKELKTALLDFYDRNGFDRNGYDRNGYDRNGFDRNGLDRDGFGRNGLDRDGFDHDGFNIEGYNRDGYDRYGYDKDGLDINNNPKPNQK